MAPSYLHYEHAFSILVVYIRPYIIDNLLWWRINYCTMAMHELKGELHDYIHINKKR